MAGMKSTPATIEMKRPMMISARIFLPARAWGYIVTHDLFSSPFVPDLISTLG